MRRITWLALVGIASGPISGCTSKKSPSAGVCDSLFDALDAYGARCENITSRFGTRDRFGEECARVLASPGPLAANDQACADAVREVTATCAPLPSPNPCHPAGSLSPGAPCGSDSQCQGGYCAGAAVIESQTPAATVTTASCGVCTAPLEIGQECKADEACVAGALCMTGSDSRNTCVAPLKEGDGCNGTGQFCASGLFCGPKQTCVPRSDAGGPCAYDQHCLWPLVCGAGACVTGTDVGSSCFQAPCARGLACDSRHVCQSRVAANPGETCDDTVSFCLKGECPIENQGAPRTCPRLLADGAPCSGDPSETCDDYAYCIAGKCQPFDPSTCR